MILNIATGKSANSKKWTNIQITWQDLVKRLSETRKTSETLKEFLACNKQDQLAIKDVGGYVGGFLSGSKRGIQNVAYRQLLTLDLDFATNDFWDIFTMFYDYAAVLHSTHKHCEENPRLRLILPLDRECTREEYEAVGRKLAGELGIELFDNTTFEPNRLMFWPSTPVDQEYYFESQEGDPVSVDYILSTYQDWKDITQWPTNAKHTEELKNRADKQEDPELKKGIIGAFCRSYTIEEAIDTFLSDFYEPTDNGRYTYKFGSTSGGLVLYENKFAFSHHGTDPTSGQLCNAFDLVRIHKFGSDNVSTKKTEDFLITDQKVKETLARERLESVSYDFAEELTEVEEVSQIDWMKELEADAKGKYLSTATNINMILQNDVQLKGKFKYNQFDKRAYLTGSVPWRRIRGTEPKIDIDESGLRNYIETIYGITGSQKIDDSLVVETEKRAFHPVRDYLNSLNWDGRQRIDTLLQEYFGAIDNIYTREAMRKMLVGAVSRVFEPGCKFDLTLVLVGETEGTGKSTFIDKLGKEWFSDTFTTVHGKEALEQVQGAWIVEIAELAGLRKAEVESIKHFLTKRNDDFRRAYGKNNERYERQCVFFGTTNNRNFLKEPRGNRRFMPVDVREQLATKSSLSSDLDNDLDQIWAEAVFLYTMGEPLYLGPEADVLAKKARTMHVEEDDRKGIVEAFLEKKLPENFEELDFFDRRMVVSENSEGGTVDREIVCAYEIWCECLQRNRDEFDRYKAREVNEMMKSIEGWEFVNSPKNFKLYGKQKYYKRI